MQVDLTDGRIGRSIILFSLPMIVGNLLQQLYNIADTLIVGRTIGAAALSAVGSAYALMVLLTSVLLGLCMGSGVVFAQLYGRKEHDRMKTSIVNAFVFIMLVSAVITAAAFLLLDHLIVWLHIPKEAAPFTKEYLFIIFLESFLSASIIFQLCTPQHRQYGDTVGVFGCLCGAEHHTGRGFYFKIWDGDCRGG
ncbi:MATE family efflux transporter, partial [Anaerostipes caccae]|uniref:MATE family efflux transporter n=1 Tax=Anaerostipes caccae TaxID=105841 RepID=UPI0023E1BC13